MPSKDSSPSPSADFEPPALVWVNVHHPTDTQQEDYRKFIRSSVTKEQHRKFRNDKGVKRSRSPTPISARPTSCRRRSSPSIAAVRSPAKTPFTLQPDWLLLLLPPYERTLSGDRRSTFEILARQEPLLRIAVQALMVARHCRTFLHRFVDSETSRLDQAVAEQGDGLIQRQLAGLSGVGDLKKWELALQTQGHTAASTGEAGLASAMAYAIGKEAWRQLRVFEETVQNRMAQPDFIPECSDAAMATVAARLQYEVELAGRGEHVKSAGQCCAALMHALQARVPTASAMAPSVVADGWWKQFECVMGAPLQALLLEPLARQLVARSLEQARDLLGPTMFDS